MSREEELRPYAHRQEISLLFSRKNIWQYREGLCISSTYLAELVLLSGLTLAAHVRLCIEIYMWSSSFSTKIFLQLYILQFRLMRVQTTEKL